MKWCMYDWSLVGPEGTCKLHEKVAQTTSITIASAAKHAVLAYRVFPMISCRGQSRLGPGLLMALHLMQAPARSGQL